MMKEKRGTLSEVISVIKSTLIGKISAAIIVIAVILYFSGKQSLGGTFFIILIAEVPLAAAVSSKRSEANKKEARRKQAIKDTQTKCIGDYLYVNEKNETFCVPSADYAQFYFSDLIDYQVIENGDVVFEGSLLGTAVGAMAGGLTGALLGASASKATGVCKELKIKLTVNSIDHPIIYITLIDSDTKKWYKEYKTAVDTADELSGVLSVIKARNGR